MAADSTRETDFDVSLVGEFYTLARAARTSTSGTSTDARERNRLGTSPGSRTCSPTTSRSRAGRGATRTTRASRSAAQIGDEWFYRNFALLLVNYANGSYDDFDGEEDLLADGVALGTVHGAKGLEWPVVFLPSLTDGRFPSSRPARCSDWLVPRDLFDAARYEGSDADERRLFYVALTRARDWVSLSSHRSREQATRVRPSPYLLEADELVGERRPADRAPSRTGIETPDLAVTYSELAAYLELPAELPAAQRARLHAADRRPSSATATPCTT